MWFWFARVLYQLFEEGLHFNRPLLATGFEGVGHVFFIFDIAEASGISHISQVAEGMGGGCIIGI